MKPNIFKNRVAKNATWIIISKIVQTVLALIIGMLTARFLGPSNYGLINYASSIVAFVVPIMNLGFSNILVQEYISHPEEEGKILGTSTLLAFASSFICICGVSLYTFVVDVGEELTHVVVLLYSLILIARAFELIQYWYQAKLMSKYMAIFSLLAYLIVSLYKVVLLISKAGVALFAITNTIDYSLIAIALYVFYRKLGGEHISFSSSVGKRMFSKSKHYIISSLMVTIFAQTDKIMIKLLINETSVGYYSAAVSCAGITSFVFAAIIDSFRPLIFAYKKNDNENGYEKSLSRLYCVVIYTSLAQSLLMTLFSREIILILYGNAYYDSVFALQIVVWYTTFSYLGSIRNIWILGEGKQKYLWILNLGGALVNVLLNFALIPFFGIYGAAIASLITQIFTNIIMNIIVWPLRRNNYIMFRGLDLRLILDLFKGKAKDVYS